MSKSASYQMMNDLILDFSNHMRTALTLAAGINLEKPEVDYKNVLILGMGGSGIGGAIVKNWIADDIAIPVQVANDYQIPAYVDQDTLVIASSYSGNTEETMMALNEALERNVSVVGITSGGKLEKFCRENNFPVFVVPGGNPPRASLGYSLTTLCAVFEKMELVTNRYTAMIEQAGKLIEQELEDIQAKGMDVAKFMFNRTPIFYSTHHMDGLAIRCRQQINENAKGLAWQSVVPEMNHNELLGWTGGNASFAPVFLLSQYEFNRNLKRIEMTKEEIASRGSSSMTFVGKGESLVEETIYLMHILDWASLYLADMKDMDPVAIPVIDKLKAALDSFSNE
jgi:glucose/mannose-6-phosphate isomerase